jgi:hypothetical protein
MAGLLDVFNSFEGQQALGLLAASGGRSDGAGFGQRLMEGLSQGDKWKAQQAAEKRAQMQEQMQMMQMQEYQNKVAEQKKMRGLAAQFAMPGTGMASDGYGPSAPASFDRQGYASALEAVDPIAGLQYAASIQKQGPKLTAYKQGDSVRDETGREVFSIPQEVKVPTLPSAIQEYEYAQKQGYKGSYEQWQNASNSAKAPKMSVDLRDPTAVAKAAMTFQNDYRTATKPSYARAQAYEAMTEASENPSAKGDLTMVYSFVKALDPESVVREGEISLLNANRNVPDKIKGYAQRLATGQSLLPKEREDLLNQARTLTNTDYKRSRNDVKAYRDNAQRLGLDADLYAPDPYATFKPKAETSTKKASISDIAATAKASGRSTKEVTDALRAKGYTIGDM